jgi:hypothetical protein
MNKAKKVAWHKHLVKAKKAKEKRRQAQQAQKANPAAVTTTATRR